MTVAAPTQKWRLWGTRERFQRRRWRAHVYGL